MPSGHYMTFKSSELSSDLSSVGVAMAHHHTTQSFTWWPDSKIPKKGGKNVGETCGCCFCTHLCIKEAMRTKKNVSIAVNCSALKQYSQISPRLMFWLLTCGEFFSTLSLAVAHVICHRGAHTTRFIADSFEHAWKHWGICDISQKWENRVPDLFIEH